MRCLHFSDEGRYSWTSSSSGTGRAAMVSSWARLSWPMHWRVADDAEEAIAHAGELGLALLEHARHRHFFRLQVLAHGGEAVDHGLHPLGELRAADVVVDE